MASSPDRCRHCGVSIPAGVAIYADRNRKYCSPSCARSQLDVEQGTARRDVDAVRHDAVVGAAAQVGAVRPRADRDADDRRSPRE